MSGRAVAAFALAGLVAGVALALVVTAATDEVYRATALLQAVPPAPAEGDSDQAQVAAASYADIADSRGFLAEHAPALGGGRLSPDELAERLDARHRDATALVEIVAREETPAGARTLADALATALVADVEQTARQRSARIEAEVRPRIEQLSAAIAQLESTTGSLRSAATTDRLRALRAERAAFQARVADAAVRGAGERVGLVVAAPASADDDPVQPRRVLNLFGGVLLGLVAGLGTSLLVSPRSRSRQAPDEAGAVSAGPSIALSAPEAGAEVTGPIVVAAETSGDASVEFLLSDGGPDWSPIAVAEGPSASAEWDANGLAPGVYWISARARDEAGQAVATEPRPVVIPERLEAT